MNLLTKINEVKKSQQQTQSTAESSSSKLDLNYLLENPKSTDSSLTPNSSKSDENLSQVDSADDCLVDISDEKSGEKKKENESIKPTKRERGEIEKLIEKLEALEAAKASGELNTAEHEGRYRVIYLL